MILKIVKLIVWILIILFISIYINYNKINNFTLKEDKNISIEKWNNITNVLSSNLNLNINFIKIYLKFNPINFTLFKWNYELIKWNSLNEIIEIFSKWPVLNSSKITILEWWNIFDIDEYLFKKDFINKWDFINEIEKNTISYSIRYEFLDNVNSLEWFLYPDTYFINPDIFNLEKFIFMILNNFENKVYSKLLKDKKSSEILNIINLASIVEKEVNKNNPSELKIVAGILSKRLENNWFIWADATVCYPYKITHKECTPSFIAKKINTDKNDYNTRTMVWLPKTPIWNPSYEIIKATVFPEKTNYWYYLHDKNWKIHYAKTNDEHNKNKYTYLR